MGEATALPSGGPAQAGVAYAPDIREWAERLLAAIDAPRVLPLPQLSQPDVTGGRGRVAVRSRARRELWCIFEDLRTTVNQMYLGRTTGGRRRRPRPDALDLYSMPPAQREASSSLLAAAKVIRSARRGLGPTGASALRELRKLEESASYVAERSDEPYVPFVADLIAEPSNPWRSVKMLGSLPAELATHYA